MSLYGLRRSGPLTRLENRLSFNFQRVQNRRRLSPIAKCADSLHTVRARSLLSVHLRIPAAHSLASALPPLTAGMHLFFRRRHFTSMGAPPLSACHPSGHATDTVQLPRRSHFTPMPARTILSAPTRERHLNSATSCAACVAAGKMLRAPLALLVFWCAVTGHSRTLLSTTQLRLRPPLRCAVLHCADPRRSFVLILQAERNGRRARG